MSGYEKQTVVVTALVSSLMVTNAHAFGLNYDGIGDSITAIRTLVAALAYLAGGISFVMAAVRLKHWAEAGNQGLVTHFTISGPILYVIIGTCLIYFASTVLSLNQTFFGDSALSFIEVQGASDCTESKKLFTVAISIVQLAGFIYMILGFSNLKFLADGNMMTNSGVLGKSLIRIIGGSLLLNIQAFSSAIAATFGIDDPIDLVGLCV